MNRLVIAVTLAAAALCFGLASAQAGPCSLEIAQFEHGRVRPLQSRCGASHLQNPGRRKNRHAFDRMVADQIQQEIDPHYERSWRRMEKAAQEKGTDYYWHPGDLEPERAPEFGNITRGDR